MFRQDKNIRSRIMKNRYKSKGNTENSNNFQPAGNFQLHSTRCKVCERMKDGRKKWKSNKTKREYWVGESSKMTSPSIRKMLRMMAIPRAKYYQWKLAG